MSAYPRTGPVSAITARRTYRSMASPPPLSCSFEYDSRLSAPALRFPSKGTHGLGPITTAALDVNKCRRTLPGIFYPVSVNDLFFGMRGDRRQTGIVLLLMHGAKSGASD